MEKGLGPPVHNALRAASEDVNENVLAGTQLFTDQGGRSARRRWCREGGPRGLVP